MSKLFSKYYDSDSSEEDETNDIVNDEVQVALDTNNETNVSDKVNKHELNLSDECEVDDKCCVQEEEDDDDDDWRKCLINHNSGSGTIRQPKLSTGVTSTAKHATNLKNPVAGNECSDHEEDDWRKCLINYTPPEKVPTSDVDVKTNKRHCTTASLISSRKRRASLISQFPHSSDSDEDCGILDPQKFKRNTAKRLNVSETDLIELDNVDFSLQALSTLSIEDLANLTVSVFLELNSVKKDVVCLKKQLKMLPMCQMTQPLERENLSANQVSEPHQKSEIAASYTHDVLDQGNDMECDSVDVKPTLNCIPSDSSAKFEELPSLAVDKSLHKKTPDECVMYKSLQFNNPHAVIHRCSEEKGEVTDVGSTIRQNITTKQRPFSATTMIGVDHNLPKPTFDLCLPPAAKTFFKHDEIVANHRTLPQHGTSSSCDIDIPDPEEGSVLQSAPLISSAASFVFGIDLCIWSIVSFLDFETRKRVAVVNSDCYSVCCHNISHVSEAGKSKVFTAALFKDENHTLYQENVLVDRNKRFIEENNISAVVKVTKDTETIKFQQSVWEQCSITFKEEVYRKFPCLITKQQQIRSDSLPAFAVTPHKNLKNYSKCESSRHIVDLSAQLVVLDRKAKVVKKHYENCKLRMRDLIAIGGSYTCFLGKITIRQPVRGKVTTKYVFNKYAWSKVALTDEDKEKYFLSRGIVTQSVLSGRVLLSKLNASSGGYNRSVSNRLQKNRKSGSVVVSSITRNGISYYT